MSGVDEMAQAIADVVQGAISSARKAGSIQTGYIVGDYVQIDTAMYPYVLAVDINVFNGAKVFCQLTSNRARAVIVGC